MRTFDTDRCLVARIDEQYLRAARIPELLKKSFGETSWNEYDFAVVPRNHSTGPLYGAAVKPDVRKSFFSVSPIHLPPVPRQPQTASAEHKNMVFVQRYESTVVAHGSAPAGLVFGEGMWELDIARKGMSLAEAFERKRRRDLLVSLGVEVLLGIAIVFLVIGVRRMQKLAEQKMQFVAAVSHELRAPVSAISMLSRNQADGLVSGQEKVQQYGELMHQQSRRLNEMVEQTLQYAGIHSNLGRPSRSEVDLKRLIREAVDARRDELARLGFDVEIDTAADLPTVYGDAKLLRIAIDNLLSNAEKYADGGRWIRVRTKHASADKEVLISVEDRGAGIPASDQDEIFEPFARGQAAIDAQIPGSGIGLSLVRSAVEAHRGTVTLVSEPGRGSTFTLHLPV
jgi:signal transduction histidine kinase